MFYFHSTDYGIVLFTDLKTASFNIPRTKAYFFVELPAIYKPRKRAVEMITKSMQAKYELEISKYFRRKVDLQATRIAGLADGTIAAKIAHKIDHIVKTAEGRYRQARRLIHQQSKKPKQKLQRRVF